MGRVFVDTSYFGAVINPQDNLHAKAMRVAAALQSERTEYVTTLAVLTELLALASKDQRTRDRAVSYLNRIRASSDFEVIAGDEDLFNAGLDLYARRSDKTYSLVDCVSMVVCKRRRITEVLTGDHDFQQEGFTILL